MGTRACLSSIFVRRVLLDDLTHESGALVKFAGLSEVVQWRSLPVPVMVKSFDVIYSGRHVRWCEIGAREEKL